MGREEPTAAGMDVDDTAETVFEKMEDDPKDDDAKSDDTNPNMPDLDEVSDDSEVKDRSAIYDSDENKESDTEYEFEQQ